MNGRLVSANAVIVVARAKTLVTEDLIDKVYEAAVVPELWDPVLDDVARRVDSAIYDKFATYGPGRVVDHGAAVCAFH